MARKILRKEREQVDNMNLAQLGKLLTEGSYKSEKFAYAAQAFAKKRKLR